jgi:hypothetical protein
VLRFTIRDAIWLTAVIIMGVAVFLTRSARENDRRTVVHRATEQEIVAGNMRYKAAKGGFESQISHWNSYHPARYSYDTACDAIERFAHAAELKNDPESKAKDLVSALKFAQYLASHLMEKKDEYADVKTSPPFYRVQYTCADIEVRLSRAEQELASAQTTR